MIGSGCGIVTGASGVEAGTVTGFGLAGDAGGVDGAAEVGCVDGIAAGWAGCGGLAGGVGAAAVPVGEEVGGDNVSACGGAGLTCWGCGICCTVDGCYWPLVTR